MLGDGNDRGIQSQVSVALRPVEIPPLYRIWRIPPAYSVVHHEFLAIGRLNPVLCLDVMIFARVPTGMFDTFMPANGRTRIR